MSGVVIEWAFGLLQALSYVYDFITFIPYYIVCNPRQKVKLSNQIKAKPVSDEAGAPYRAVEALGQLSTTLFPECSTIDDLFSRAVRLYGTRRCLGARVLLSEDEEIQPNGKVFKKVILGDYHWENFEQVGERVKKFGYGLRALGQKPRKNILIFAETRAEWMIAAQSCLRFNIPIVTLYSTLGEQAIIHGIVESEVTHVITTADLLPKFKGILSQISNVTHIIYMNGGKKVPPKEVPNGVQVHSMKEVETMGEENRSGRISKPTREDTAVIMYTSGSTGIPKAVIMSHGNLMCGMSGQCKPIPNLGPEDTYIAYLPLAHVLELTAEMSCLAHGTSLGYSSPLTLSDQSSKIKKGSKGDATVLKPTLMAAVPVIMDRLYKAVWDKVNSEGEFTKALFKFAYEYKNRRLESGYDTPALNRIFFKKIRTILGGRVRMMLSGGAPLSSDTQRFMNICFCCPVGQGYGLTETSGAGTIAEVYDLSTGRVGAPLACCEIRLRDWVEGGYVSKNGNGCPKGEILIGGGNVAQGYYKKPDLTKEDFTTIDGQWYFCTGDIGQFEPDGCLRIIDRKKDLVKLQTGEYVSLGKVETALKLCPIVDQVCVFADSHHSYTVVLIVPNRKLLRQVATKLTISDDSEDAVNLCSNKLLEKEVLKLLTDFGRKGKLERFELPQKITLCPEPWTPDKGLVTDAYKLKRKAIKEAFQDSIAQMYPAK